MMITRHVVCVDFSDEELEDMKEEAAWLHEICADSEKHKWEDRNIFYVPDNLFDMWAKLFKICDCRGDPFWNSHKKKS